MGPMESEVDSDHFTLVGIIPFSPYLVGHCGVYLHLNQGAMSVATEKGIAPPEKEIVSETPELKIA